MVEAKPRHHAGAKVFHHDVGFPSQFVDDGFGRIGLQIDRDAFLAAVECAEIGAAALPQWRSRADQISLRSLDLDDFSAKVGHQAGAMRAGQHRGEIQHPDAL